MVRYSAGRSNYGGSGSEDLVKWWRGKVADVESAMAEELEQFAEDGAFMVLENIETRGTGKTWQKPWEGREGSSPGRSHTGRMMKGVDYDFNPATKGGKTTAKFGWIKPSQIEDYFGYQEGGFDHAITGEHIEGMYAVVDAYELAKLELEERLKRTINGR